MIPGHKGWAVGSQPYLQLIFSKSKTLTDRNIPLDRQVRDIYHTTVHTVLFRQEKFAAKNADLLNGTYSMKATRLKVQKSERWLPKAIESQSTQGMPDLIVGG